MRLNTIAAKIGLWFSIIGIFIIGSISYALYQTAKIEELTNYTNSVRLPTLSISADLLSQIQKSTSDLRKWQLLKNSDYIVEHKKTWDKINENIAQLNELTKKWTRQINKDRFNLIKEKVYEFAALQDQLEKNGGDNRYHEEISKLNHEIVSTLNTLIDSQEEYTFEIVNQSYSESALFKEIQFIMLALGVLASLIIAILCIREISSPVHTVIDAANRISQGDYKFKINLSGFHEIEMLKSALEGMIQKFKNIAKVAESVSSGDYNSKLNIENETDTLSISINKMTENLEQLTTENKIENWVKSGQVKLSNVMRGEQEINSLLNNIIECLGEYLSAQLAAFYLYQDDGTLKLVASYAFTNRKGLKSVFKPGESLVGQAALEKKPMIITDVPREYIKINSALGDAVPTSILLCPTVFNDQVKGVMEFGSFNEFSQHHLKLLTLLSENIAIAINSAEDRKKLHLLLDETRQQSQELEQQREELSQSNRELELQKDELQKQSDEMQKLNVELEEKTDKLEDHFKKMTVQNNEIIKAKKELQKKAEELELTSRYKSEFLANMSHELRTPLNSIMILSKIMLDNKTQNLNEKQLEYIRTVRTSGEDLLALINDVLDISKIEAGRLELSSNSINTDGFIEYFRKMFDELAKEKGLAFHIHVDENIPLQFDLDEMRLKQVIKNILSNAFKFTNSGSIHLDVKRDQEYLTFSIEDTGIGIPDNKQTEVFEAFCQLDSGTNRKYNGTGLGLSISKKIVSLMGGELKLESTLGKGSKFSIIIPFNKKVMTIDLSQNKATELKTPAPTSSVPESKTIKKMPTILIIEDDKETQENLRRICRKEGFQTTVTGKGEEGLRLAKELKPDAITLDIDLPDISGFDVLSSLKSDDTTSDIPIHVISKIPESYTWLTQGAATFINKPLTADKLTQSIKKIETQISSSVQSILVVEDDKIQLEALVEAISKKDLKVVGVATYRETLQELRTKAYDCLVLDLLLPDCDAKNVIADIRQEFGEKMPIIVYTGRDLTSSEELEIRKYADDIIIKGGKSIEKLIDEISIFLHKLEGDFPSDVKNILAESRGKKENTYKCLIVDDDIRNIFSLTSLLEEHQIKVSCAENGKEALRVLNNNPEDIDLILMDIMMPEMDGYTAIKTIRKIPELKEIPIIAVTAKAMKEDQEKCIDVGANDYISKPIDIDRLLNLIDTWTRSNKFDA